MNYKINLKSLTFHLLVPIMLLFMVLMIIPDYSKNYNSLDLPFPAVPGTLFFGLYSFMYLVFGIAAYFVEEEEGEKNQAFNYYYISLFLNLLYIPIIFGTRVLLTGFLWSVILLVFIFLTCKEFRKLNKLSGKLYLIYLVFALFLTYYSLLMYLLNR